MLIGFVIQRQSHKTNVGRYTGKCNLRETHLESLRWRRIFQMNQTWNHFSSWEELWVWYSSINQISILIEGQLSKQNSVTQTDHMLMSFLKDLCQSMSVLNFNYLDTLALCWTGKSKSTKEYRNVRDDLGLFLIFNQLFSPFPSPTSDRICSAR